MITISTHNKVKESFADYLCPGFYIYTLLPRKWPRLWETWTMDHLSAAYGFVAYPRIPKLNIIELGNIAHLSLLFFNRYNG